MTSLPRALTPSVALIIALGCTRGESDGAKGDTTSVPESNATLATFDGIGRARIGASAAQLSESGTVPPAGADTACRIVSLDWMPAGTRVMFIRDTVARIDLDSTSTVRTSDGAAVGDPEARISQLYANVQTLPHKYVTGGHYLTVQSSNDSTRRIVFETDGNTVKRYRVGRQPEVDFVEGCG